MIQEKDQKLLRERSRASMRAPPLFAAEPEEQLSAHKKQNDNKKKSITKS
jgi:hypothetical protein